MKTSYIAIDGKTFDKKCDCINHEAELHKLQALIFKAMDSGVFSVMKRKNSNNTIVPILDSRYVKNDLRFYCNFVGFKIYDRFGFKEFIIFKHKGRRLKIIKYTYDECETWTTYCGSVFLNKI